jgi:hypothetical protein
MILFINEYWEEMIVKRQTGERKKKKLLTSYVESRQYLSDKNKFFTVYENLTILFSLFYIKSHWVQALYCNGNKLDSFKFLKQ